MRNPLGAIGRGVPGTGAVRQLALMFGAIVAGSGLAAAATTITIVTSSANPVQIPLVGNSTATITATVTSGGTPVTIGTVSFSKGGVQLSGNVPLNASGQASFTFNTTGTTQPVLGEGTHSINAVYSGATELTGSSGSITQVVDRATQVTGRTYCNTGGFTWPGTANGAASVYPSKIFVTGLSGTVQTVVMDLKGFTHPFSEDSSLLLVSPTGQKFIPFAYISNLSATANANITLSDAAGSALPTGGGISTGTYRPSHGLNGVTFTQATFPSPAPAGPYNNAAPAGVATFAGVFAGAAPNGTWSLYAVNSLGTPGPGVREISNGWCLTFGTSSDPASTTIMSVTPSPSELNEAATLSALVSAASSGAPVNAQGTVSFVEGSNILAGPLQLDSAGNASIDKSDLTEGAHFLTANYSGAPGFFGPSSGQVLHYVDAPTTSPSQGRFCNTSLVTFPNTAGASGSPYPTRIKVNGLAGLLSKVTLSLNGLSHNFPDDMDLMLTGPTGVSLIAMSDAGGSTAVSNLNLTLDSSAASALPDSSALSSGTFRPADYQVSVDTFATPAPVIGALSASTASFGVAYAGTNPNGVWSLWTTNDSSGTSGGGTLEGGWCLDLTMSPPALTISKTHSGNFAQGQSGAQYTVTVGSSGPGATSGTITVVDNPPLGLTITGMSGSGWDCDVNTRTCTTETSLAANTSQPEITVTVDVAANASSPLVNSAKVSGGGAAGSVTANDSTIIVAAADLTISKTTTSTFRRGGAASYALTVSNIGSGASSGPITVLDSMPTGLTLSGITAPGGWNCSASIATLLECVFSSSIPAGGSAPAVTFTVGISPEAPASITNTATVSGGGEVVTANNAGSVTVNVQIPDLTVSKTTSSTFRRGGAASYALTVSNIGPGASSGTITLLDSMPAGLTLSGVTASGGWNCSTSTASLLQCVISASIPAGGSAPVVTINVGISPDAPASITNTATVSGGGEAVTTNNSGSVTVNVQMPDLTISKTTSSTFRQGGAASYALTVSNIGSSVSLGSITLLDSMPAGLTLSGVTASGGWNCAASTGTLLQCVISASIPAGGSTPAVTINVGISPDAPASITNTATVSGGGEAVTTNNSGSVTVNVASTKTAVTIQVPPGISFVLNGQQFTGTQTVQLAAGSYPLATTTPQTLSPGTRAVFFSWSDGGAISHSITVGASPVNITGVFETQHQLTTAASPSNGGVVTPASGVFHPAGTLVNLSATPSNGFAFTSWAGPVASAGSASTTVTMNAPATVTANFGPAAAPAVTSQLTISRTSPAFNRATGRFSQTVRITNNGGALSGLAYVLDSLSAGYTVLDAGGVTSAALPAGSPYKEIGAIGPGETYSFTLEFVRTGNLALTYTPRVLGAGAR